MTEYFVFHKEWNELRKTLSKNAWYELETLMLQLRWEGIDTDPLTIKNQIVRSNWINVRARILNSMKNLKAKKGNKIEQEIKPAPTKNTDITPNNEFDTTVTTGLPTVKIEEHTKQTDTKDVAKVEIQAQNADLSDNFDNYSERLSNLIDDNINKIRQSTDILAQKQVEIGSQMDNTVAFHRNVLYDLRKRLGWDTKDGIDFQQFIDEEINRKTAQIRYERAF